MLSDASFLNEAEQLFKCIILSLLNSDCLFLYSISSLFSSPVYSLLPLEWWWAWTEKKTNSSYSCQTFLIILQLSILKALSTTHVKYCSVLRNSKAPFLYPFIPCLVAKYAMSTEYDLIRRRSSHFGRTRCCTGFRICWVFQPIFGFINLR